MFCLQETGFKAIPFRASHDTVNPWFTLNTVSPTPYFMMATPAIIIGIRLEFKAHDEISYVAINVF